jgi:uncharacterized 2Fe-2S/4Fe-4S cluster protein (DUF4445 family)
MTTLTVIHDGAILDIPLPVGSSVREALELAEVPVRWGCAGNGACGLCAVKIHAGTPNEPTDNERLLVSGERIESGIRLACQLTPEEDLRIEVVSATLSPRVIEALPVRVSGEASGVAVATPTGNAGYGVAVDVGTTHVRVSLCDLETGERVAACAVDNPQSRSGADVMTRLVAANTSADAAKRIAMVLIDAVREAIGHACASAGIDSRAVVSARMVGNTPMLLLVTMGDTQALLEPHTWTSPLERDLDGGQEWGRAFGIDSDASVEVVQPLAGFVGSDLLAAVLATGLVEAPRCLLIDFGTNSEIALWDGSTLWVTSAAGGPAFESFGLTCGMPAEAGAIRHVRREDGSGELCYDVIGGGPAKGVCGSGFVDLVAHLRDTGNLSAVGRLDEGHEDGFELRAEGSHIRLMNRDVDTFQRAKAAVGAGVATLLGMAGMAQADVERVCVCGAFGRHMNSDNAAKIGLLPDIPAERFELHEEAAVQGCEQLLVGTSAAAARLESLRERAVVVNLAQTPDFETLFLDNLYLRPLGMIVS